jgi:putative spermidine/putrescine transport system ATP-binding protein
VRKAEAAAAAVDAPAVSLRGVSKRFGAVSAVQAVDLDVQPGEFFSMLGPSGSGKTTVLRMIAGFEQPSTGSVHLAGADVTARAPFDRDVTTVFQDYALFPHLNIRDNVAYGLRVRGVGRSARREQADEALARVRLQGYGDRKPSDLSGGQRQRVALARALVVQPAVLLLDEPLGALDLKLREEMQVELKGIQRQVGITFVFVTHDQAEALSMSDRVAVFDQGRVVQVGTPAEVYEHPRTPFVAGFVGSSNVVHGAFVHDHLGMSGVVSIRPEKITVDLDEKQPVARDRLAASGTVSEVVYAGADTRYVVALDAGPRMVAVEQNQSTSSMQLLQRRGTRVRLSWDREHCVEIPDGDLPEETR